MSNYVKNVLRVTGPKDRLQEFAEAVRVEELDTSIGSFVLNKIIPGYEKFAYAQEFEAADDSLRYAFETTWVTPMPIWVTLSCRFPDLRFCIEYADEDWGSNCGIYQWDGKRWLHESKGVEFAEQMWGVK